MNAQTLETIEEAAAFLSSSKGARTELWAADGLDDHSNPSSSLRFASYLHNKPAV